jgi:hypothetical protein
MMSGHEADRRGVDGAIHDTRSQITEYDKQLHEFRLVGVTESPERTVALKARSELSAAHGFNKGFVRRQEKARRRQQPTSMTRGVAFRIV